MCKKTLKKLYIVINLQTLRLFLDMKKILLLYIVFNTLFFYAQNSVKLDVSWQENKKLIFDTYNLSIPQFQFANFYFNDVDRSIYFKYKITVTNPIEEKSLQISSVIYESISQNELGDLTIKNIPNNINPSIKNGNARDLKQILFTFSPIIKTNEGLSLWQKNIKKKGLYLMPSRRNLRLKIYMKWIYTEDWSIFKRI